MNESLQELTASTYTRSNVHKKVLLLREFFSDFFFKEHTTEDRRVALGQFLDKQQTTPDIKETLMGLSDSFYGFFTQDNFSNALDDVENHVNESPLMTIYVPTLLPPSEVVRLGQWVRANVEQRTFIDISIDTHSVGGCAFVWNGVMHDFSLGHYFDESRTEIKQILKSYDGQ